LQHRPGPCDPGAQRTARHPRWPGPYGSAATPIRCPARSQARGPPGSSTGSSSPRPGISTSIPSRPTANTSTTPTSAWPAPPTPAGRGSGGIRSRGPMAQHLLRNGGRSRHARQDLGRILRRA
jgi:hypothetical protein